MKTKKRYLICFAVLSLMVVSCQKEPMEVDLSSVTTTETSISIIYTLNGTDYYASFSSEEAWQTFLSRLFLWAQEGRSVVFANANTTTINTKQTRETETYTTQNEKDAIAWADLKTKEGYKVIISFDPENGIFTCIAIR